MNKQLRNEIAMLLSRLDREIGLVEEASFKRGRGRQTQAVRTELDTSVQELREGLAELRQLLGVGCRC